MATSGRSRAFEILQSLRNDWSVSDADMLDYIIRNWMSGDQAEAVMVDFSEECDILIPSKEDDES